jgi:hypothetical protein
MGGEHVLRRVRRAELVHGVRVPTINERELGARCIHDNDLRVSEQNIQFSGSSLFNQCSIGINNGQVETRAALVDELVLRRLGWFLMLYAPGPGVSRTC